MLSVRTVLRQLLFTRKILTTEQISIGLSHAFSQSLNRTQESAKVVEEIEGVDGQDTPSKPRRLQIDPETSIRYMESQAYDDAYGKNLVWKHYRRNFKGQYQPRTRKTCIRGGEISTGSPCPICRDEYLIVNFKNIRLLEQFISPYTGELMPTKRTGVCQKQQKNLRVEIAKAQDSGYIQTTIPFREYNYQEYYDMIGQKQDNT
ncbi:hypothetical protein ScPMuIL_010419 [Solemya velum]